MRKYKHLIRLSASLRPTFPSRGRQCRGNYAAVSFRHFKQPKLLTLRASNARPYGIVCTIASLVQREVGRRKPSLRDCLLWAAMHHDSARQIWFPPNFRHRVHAITAFVGASKREQKTIPQSANADSSLYAREPMTHPDSATALRFSRNFRNRASAITVSVKSKGEPPLAASEWNNRVIIHDLC